MTLTIWGRLNSHNATKVVWLAGEIFPRGSTPKAGSSRAYRAAIIRRYHTGTPAFAIGRARRDMIPLT